MKLTASIPTPKVKEFYETLLSFGSTFSKGNKHKRIPPIKNKIRYLIFFFVSLFACNINAQTNISSNISASSTNLSTSKDVKIITNFKATKSQKRVIRKMKKYVSSRFLGRRMRSEALIGKPVKVQLNIDTNGNIHAISVIKGQGLKIDKRVIDLIRQYDKKRPIAASKIEKPSIMQLAVPLVSKRYF